MRHVLWISVKLIRSSMWLYMLLWSIKWWYWVVSYGLYNYINIRHFNMSFWDYEVVIEIEYKWQVEHVLICEIHMNMWWWIVKLGDVKLWTWDLVVNKCLGPWRIRIWFCCEFSFEKLAWKAQGRVFFDFFFANGVCFDGSAECGWIIKFLRIMPVSGNVDWMWISGFVYHQLLFDLFVGVYVFTLWVLSEVIQWY